MTVRKAVNILREFAQDEAETLTERYGPEAVSLAQDMQEILRLRFEQEVKLAMRSLWRGFQEAPDDTAEELIGALEAMVEAEPSLGRRLNAFVENFYELTASRGEESATLASQNLTATDVTPDTTVTSGEKYNKGEGEYLYGNVKAGTQSLDEEVGAVEVREPRAPVTIDAETLPAFFGHLREAVDTHPDLSPEQKSLLLERLQEVETLLPEGATAPATPLSEHLAQIREMSPDIAERLRHGLRNFDVDLST